MVLRNLSDINFIVVFQKSISGLSRGLNLIIQMEYLSTGNSHFCTNRANNFATRCKSNYISIYIAVCLKISTQRH